MDIQLTQYGKYLLSKGKFKPHCYAFFDDDIIYDPAYAGQPKEDKEETFKRIGSVPRLKTIHNITSVETRVKELNEQNFTKALDEFQNPIQDYFKSSKSNLKKPIDDIYGLDDIESTSMLVDNRSILKNILGNSEIGNQDYPSWNIRSLTPTKFNEPVEGTKQDGSLTLRTPPLRTSSSYDEAHVKRYQLEMKPRMIVMNHSSDLDNDDLGLFRTQTGFEDTIEDLPDDRILTFLQKPDIILDVRERNVFFQKENFDVEVFEVIDETERSQNFLKRLYFTEDMEEEDVQRVPIESRVETYLEINFDAGIDIPADYLDVDKLKIAIEYDRLGEYFSSRPNSGITIFKNGVDITKSESENNRNLFNDMPGMVRPEFNRSQIGESLYDFDRELFEDGDDEGCD